MYKKSAFTIAEILIVICVIGVIAAITLSNFIQDCRKKQTVVALKKGYSIFSSAFELAEEEFGPIKDWEEVQSDYNPECVLYKGTKCTQQFVEKYLKQLNVTDYRKRKLGKTLSGYDKPIWVGYEHYWYYLADGSCFLIVLSYDNYWFNYVFYDINGDKKPNTLGKDIFVFDFGRVQDYKFGFDSEFTNLKTIKNLKKFQNFDVVKFLTQDARTACSKTAGYEGYRGYSCGALIQYQGWKITKDYPW